MNAASIQRLTWKHYICAVLAAYLSPWLAAYLAYVLFHMLLGIPASGFIPDDAFSTLVAFFFAWIPASIEFIILLPFLRSRRWRLLVYTFICVGWLLLFWFTPNYIR